MEKLISFIEHLPVIFVIINLLLWITGIINTVSVSNISTQGSFIEQFFLEVKLSQSFKKFFYPILETATLYTSSIGIFLVVPFIYYYKGNIDGYYIKYALLGKIPKEFVFIYLLVLIPASLGVYYGFRLFIALILDCFDIRDKHIEIKRSFYGFLVCMLGATIIGLILILLV